MIPVEKPEKPYLIGSLDFTEEFTAFMSSVKFPGYHFYAYGLKDDEC